MKKIYKILLVISFLPYALILVGAGYCAIFGMPDLESIILTLIATPWLGEQEINIIYGVEAFKTSIILLFGGMLVGVPIIPISFIYQIIYLILIIRRKKCKKDKLEKIKVTNIKEEIK